MNHFRNIILLSFAVTFFPLNNIVAFTIVKSSAPSFSLNTSTLTADKLVAFAKSLKGIKYKYGASHPKVGFDCSGFVNYVFKNFSIDVPRSSASFKNHGRTISLKEAKQGDLILFTGPNIQKKTIGHIGIITSASGKPIHFIHSTSGKAYSVTETPFNESYKRRFVKVVRVF
ncbi:C40 family peptidase [Olivibacter sp. SDN3]|uniref:C40 family peptidase n=1 Tax=Olivibacter sp. SDN3 TaxID=2764720 RepID=UPI0016511447|nr:C40 family peptidase [Olivibacter sp. SDN3]QNL49300.1 C40 family peptidase [Olivibacter sp. SDN3]